MSTAPHATADRIGIFGSIQGYQVTTLGDLLIVEHNGAERARTRVDGLARFVGNARLLALGWAQFPDDAEVIFLYDKADTCFGYAVNLDWPDGSEWGYAPFHRDAA